MTCRFQRWTAVLGMVMSLSVLTHAQAAAGQEMPTQPDMPNLPEARQLNAVPMGTIGLGLIGAELGLVVPALLGVEGTWAYLVFPATGAAVGALTGYLALDRGLASPAVSIVTLSLGMALLIPSVLATATLTAYNPESDSYGRGGDARPRSLPRRMARERRVESGGLMRWSDDGSVALALPAVASVPVHSERDVRQLGVRQGTEWRISLVSGAF